MPVLYLMPMPFGLPAEEDLYIILFICGRALGNLVSPCHYRGVYQVVVHENMDSVADSIAGSDDVSKAGFFIAVGIPFILCVCAGKYA